MYFPCCLAVLGAIPTEDLMSLNSSNTFSTSSKSLSTLLSPSSLITTTAIQECSTINENIIVDDTEKTQFIIVNEHKFDNENGNNYDNKNESVNENKNKNKNEYDSKLKNKNIKLNYVSSRQMTYCVWGQGDKNPKTFSTLTPDTVNFAKIQKSIFLRKFILPSNSPNFHDKDKRQDHIDKRRNNQVDFSEYRNEVKSIEVEKRILLCAWLTLVLKIEDTSDKKITGNIGIDDNSEYNDSNDKIIKETNVSILESNSINEELTNKEIKIDKEINVDKEINIDKEIEKSNSNENRIFDFNYCLQKSDLYSIQNKEMNDQYRRDKFEKFKIDNENRDRQNYSDNHSNEHSFRECDRYGRSASRHHNDIVRDNQGPEPWGTSNNCSRSNDNNNNNSRRNDNNNNDYNRNYNKKDRRSRGRVGDRERERYDNDDDNNRERYDNNQSESHNKKRKVDDEESKIMNNIIVDGEKEQIIAI